MPKKWYEDVMSALCDFWWVLLIFLVLGLVLYFTGIYWLPLLGLG